MSNVSSGVFLAFLVMAGFSCNPHDTIAVDRAHMYESEASFLCCLSGLCGVCTVSFPCYCTFGGICSYKCIHIFGGICSYKCIHAGCQVEPPGSGDALRTLRALESSGTSPWWLICTPLLIV